MGTVRSIWSFSVSMGSRSSSLRSMSSRIFARHSSDCRRAVTFGCGMVEETSLSMFSRMMLRIWDVLRSWPFFFLSFGVSGVISRTSPR